MQLTKLDFDPLDYGPIDIALQKCSYNITKDEFVTSISLQSSLVSWIFDIGLLADNLQTWQTTFPKIQPLFSLKYSKMGLLPFIKKLGMGFACDTKRDLIAAECKSIRTTNVLFDNKGKPKSNIRPAVEGKCVLVVRSEKDITQISSFKQTGIRVVLDVNPNMKTNAVLSLVESIEKHKINIIGIHCDLERWLQEDALVEHMRALDNWMTVLESRGHSMQMLDLGNVSVSDTNLSEMLNGFLDNQVFKHWPQITVTADASEVLMEDVLSVVVGIKSVQNNTCVINDGVYGSFAALLSGDKQLKHAPWVVKQTGSGVQSGELIGFKIKGSEENEFDTPFTGEFQLPSELTVNDMLVFDDMAEVVTNYTLETIQMNNMTEPNIEVYLHGSHMNCIKDLECKEFNLPECFHRGEGDNRLTRADLDSMIENLSLMERTSIRPRPAHSVLPFDHASVAEILARFNGGETETDEDQDLQARVTNPMPNLLDDFDLKFF